MRRDNLLNDVQPQAQPFVTTHALLAVLERIKQSRMPLCRNRPVICDREENGLADSLNPFPPRQAAASLEAIRYLERKVSEASDLKATALRYCGLYGPGTPIASKGGFVESVKKRRFPLSSPGTATWSFVHVHDAATATAAAVESAKAGIYNVSDDEPAPVNV